ncbi:MAG: hypothetical protein QM764_23845 [Chitinophagaceae bacterium]
MQFFKNIAFSLIIRAVNRLREFNFRKRNQAEYDCDVCNERGERIFFKIRKSDGHWNIAGNDLPSWVVNSEDSICSALESQPEFELA